MGLTRHRGVGRAFKNIRSSPYAVHGSLEFGWIIIIIGPGIPLTGGPSDGPPRISMAAE